ncbi:NAD(P)/FAD-dependent oxidoreductase [Arenimonas composti]|uniref:FAD/NAD(P)-binding domain-containing protein n=1 Tax=Arenimonas composti TR7-09 = DSM 18010 TaxID=1121013 RepID=A0A091BBW6_9GAMM|nr:NAD(P)/FAD-dependent oxidoreductase [Arenimonas composti]KFN50158.1 hypothetical protein P873_07935 [Arenimonas composti TR7-09 = DSM 18010]
MSRRPLDCLIVGGGPAGLVTATYLARYRREVVLVDAGDSRAAKIPKARNVPGFPDGISGRRLLQRLRAQAETAGVTMIAGSVETLRREADDDDGHFVAGAGRRRFQARRVLLATGMSDHAPVPGLGRRETLTGVVRWCPICDGREALDKRVVLLGEADHGVAHALFLRTWTRRLTLVLDPAEKLPAKARRELDAAGIGLIREKVRRVHVPLMADAEAARATGGEVEFADGDRLGFDAIYPMTGGRARVELARALGARCRSGEGIRVGARQTCSVPGLYAAGDVVASLRQISVAVGEGALAATAIHNSLPRNSR